MAALVLGLVLFLGVHSTRVFAEGWRTATMERFGEKEYKILYSLLAIAGLVTYAAVILSFLRGK